MKISTTIVKSQTEIIFISKDLESLCFERKADGQKKLLYGSKFD